MEIRRTKILGFTLLLAGLALCGTGLWLLLKPAQYQATARIKVEREITVGSDMSYDPYFIQTEFEIIQSQIVLGKVVEALNLNVEWGKKYSDGSPVKITRTIESLKRRMNLEPVRNTKLIKISFTSDDPNEAARIANAIAEAYQDYSQATRRQVITRGIEVLTEQYQKEEEQIRVVQTNVDLLQEKLKILSDPATWGIETEKVIKEMQTTLNQLRKCPTNKLRDVLPTISPDGALSGLLDKLHEAEQKYHTLTNDYQSVDMHATQVNSMIEELNRQVDDRVNAVMANLENGIKTKQAELEIENNHREQSRKLEQMIEFHKVLAAKIEAEKLDLQIPKTSMVQIIDRAEPPKFPVSPNRWLATALLILGLCSTIGGFLVLKSSKWIR